MARIGFRKSIRLGKSGVRINLSKRGVGVSAGVKGFRVGTGPSGTRARATLPGTGLYMEKRFSKGKKRARTQSVRHTTTEDNQQVYRDFLALVEELKTYHRGEVEPIHWNQVLYNPPFEGGIGPREQKKRKRLASYEPSFVIKLLRLDGIKRKHLEKAVEQAKEEDNREYVEWIEKKEMGEGLLRNQKESVKKVLERYSTFYDNPEMAHDVTVTLKTEGEQRVAYVSVYTLSDDDLPDFEVNLTKTGRVSEKKMAKGKFYELQQQHISSVLVRIMRELFALLPIEVVHMNAYKKEVDPAIGRDRDIPIIAVRVWEQELSGIQFDYINPFDTLSHFRENRVNFRKTKGFGEIEPF